MGLKSRHILKKKKKSLNFAIFRLERFQQVAKSRHESKKINSTLLCLI
jgi:hypothetical protein